MSTDLIDQVKTAFAKTRTQQEDTPGPIQVLRSGADELCPGFDGMRRHYDEKLHVLVRRAYRHFAGSTLPSDGDDLLAKTGEFLVDRMIAMCMLVFSDGVLIGHHDDHLVKMCMHFGNVEHLFHDDDFRAKAKTMGDGFAEDPAVLEFFTDYVVGGLSHISHITGFAHSEVDHNKVWDIWMMTGTATTAASYMSGHALGASWAERDEFDGIVLASEGDPR